MLERFIPASSVHACGTRFRDIKCFTIPKVKVFGKKSFAYNGCALRNTLPKEITSIQRHQALNWLLNLTF